MKIGYSYVLFFILLQIVLFCMFLIRKMNVDYILFDYIKELLFIQELFKKKYNEWFLFVSYEYFMYIIENVKIGLFFLKRMERIEICLRIKF